MKKIIFLSFIIMLLCGCYDYRELNDMSIVSGIGIADAEANVNRLNTEINDNAELMRIAASYVDDYNNEYQDNVAGMEAATKGVHELELAQKN